VSFGESIQFSSVGLVGAKVKPLSPWHIVEGEESFQETLPGKVLDPFPDPFPGSVSAMMMTAWRLCGSP
jgi:hypothetical protein